MKKLGVGCLTVFMGCLVLYIVSILWQQRDSYYVDTTNRLYDGIVAESFIMALVESKEIKLLVAQERWPEIDNWMRDHHPVKCPSISLKEDAQFQGGGHPLALEHKSVYDLSYILYCPQWDSPYHFAIKDLMLQRRKDGQWVVVSWGEICETYPDEEARCIDMLK